MIASNPVARTQVLLAASSVAASVTGTLVETALATVTIPAGAMGLNGGLEVITVWSYTNSANAKNLKQKLGATTYRSNTRTTTGMDNFLDLIRNRGSASSQLVMLGYGNAASGIQTVLAENSANSLAFTITGQLALATETITLESYEVWLLP